MSLLFFDGFDGYSVWSDLTTYGQWVQSSSSYILDTTVRTGTGKCFTNNPSATGPFKYMYPADQAGKTVYVGFAYRKSGVASSDVLSVHIADSNSQIKLSLDGLNRLRIINPWTSAVLAAGTKQLLANVWYYIEVKFLIADTGGIFECRINGTVEFSYSGDTQGYTNNGNVLLQFYDGGSMSASYDDMYILNSDGTTNNTYLGEVRCQLMNPNTDNAITWARNTGTTNFGEVNQAVGSPDGDTTYVYSNTSGQKDEYGLTDLTGVGTVAGVKLVTRAEKDDVNPLSLKHGIKSGGVDQQVTFTLGQSYGNYVNIFETADGVNTPFTATTINSLASTIQLP